MEEYRRRVERLVGEMSSAGAALALHKDTSNLFRDRVEAPARRLDVRGFRHVLAVDAREGLVEVEGMTPYAALVDATLAHGVLPAVVPELRSITIGGAVSGVGIESSSFRYGLVHETVLEMDVLTGDGRVVTCTPGNEHRDLFFGFPNSYGTLGYALRLKAMTVPAGRYVMLRHVRHRDPATYFRNLEEWSRREVDFLDGTVFSPDELYLTIGTFTDEAPYTSDYTWCRVYYRSIRERETDYLTARDYIWRWDTDWFWCSKHVFAQNPVVRLLAGRKRLNSVTYTRIMRWNSRWGLSARLNRLRGLHTESVIQDVDVPVENAVEFLDFFQREIGISPVWICPVRSRDPSVSFDLYPMDPDRVFVNFGFWDVVSTRSPYPEGHFNRLIERKVQDLGGIKSLYSSSYFPEEEFWSIYNRPAYERLKARYDPEGRLRNLYEKCVLGR